MTTIAPAPEEASSKADITILPVPPATLWRAERS